MSANNDYVIYLHDCNCFLAFYDPNFNAGGGSYPTGKVLGTLDPDTAMRFESQAAALDCWKQSSTVCPLRPDGQPNRPLTSYSISVIRLDQMFGALGAGGASTPSRWSAGSV